MPAKAELPRKPGEICSDYGERVSVPDLDVIIVENSTLNHYVLQNRLSPNPPSEVFVLLRCLSHPLLGYQHPTPLCLRVSVSEVW